MRHLIIPFAQWLWALPLTLLGLPVWAVVKVFGKRSRHQAFISRQPCGWVLIAHGPFLKSLLKRHPFGRMQAVAVGCCIFANDARTLAAHLPHELVHVRQAQQWGIFFPLAYLASSAWQRLHGRCAYADNWFERQANRV